MNATTTYDQKPLDYTSPVSILVVDDAPAVREAVELICTPLKDIQVLKAASIEEANQMLLENDIRIMVLDKNLGSDPNDPAQNGILAIPQFLSLKPFLQILVLTSSDDISDVVEAMSFGAFSYVLKNQMEKLLVPQIEKAFCVSEMKFEKAQRETKERIEADEVELAGSSLQMRRLKDQIQLISESDKPVLLLGETGTGKTVAAQMIHRCRESYLKQKKRPFIELNFAAISSSLAERELFGNEAGAFTGAIHDKPGFFELANGGTLFLDEIGDAPLDLQMKILKVIEQGRFYRLGGKTEIRSYFKLVCATNKNLEEMIQKGAFREDLYMRISTFPIQMPSLKDRSEDVPDIVKSILPRLCRENKVKINFSDLPEDLLQYLKSVPFSGNIRGLDQTLSRLLVLSKRDRNGLPLLKQWKSILRSSGRTQYLNDGESITFSDLIGRPFNVIDDRFPGLQEFSKKVTEKVYEEALQKYSTNHEIAKALKISPASASLHLKTMNLSKRERKNLKHIPSHKSFKIRSGNSEATL